MGGKGFCGRAVTALSLASNVPPEVAPARVQGLNQLVLPRAALFLDALLASDGILDALVNLVPDEQLAAMRLGEAGTRPSRCS